MGFLSRLFRGAKEDPTVYGNELKQLRGQMRAKGGVLQCLNCGCNVRIDLKTIERQIRQNRDVAADWLFGSHTFVTFSPDWGKASVCKKCEGVLCGSCSEKIINDLSGLALAFNLPCCPKCGNVIDGIDHITD